MEKLMVIEEEVLSKTEVVTQVETPHYTAMLERQRQNQGEIETLHHQVEEQ